MKILLCHGYYTQRGGEDRSFEEERELLIAGGHDVVEYVRQNNDMHALGPTQSLATTLWNRSAAADFENLVRRERPDVVHCTNIFPLISPAVCHVAHRHGAAVVQALRNYRLLCANASLLRDGRPCEDCIGKALPWPAIIHRCYHDSTGHTAAVAAMQVLHRAIGTWRRKIDAFFTLTHFARQKFVDAGFPADRLHVKYNSVVPDPGVGDGSGGYAAFAARLAPEKGVACLLAAWRNHPDLPPLKIVGAGPLSGDVAAAAAADSRIEWLGHKSEAEVHRVFGSARAVIMPSIWYETFGRTIAEAFAGGTPVVASRLGAMAELVADGRTGWLFAPTDADDLARRVRHCWSTPTDSYEVMRIAAREIYEREFTAQRNYDRMLEIYEIGLDAARRRRRSPLPTSQRAGVIALASAGAGDVR